MSFVSPSCGLNGQCLSTEHPLTHTNLKRYRDITWCLCAVHVIQVMDVAMYISVSLTLAVLAVMTCLHIANELHPWEFTCNLEIVSYSPAVHVRRQAARWGVHFRFSTL